MSTRGKVTGVKRTTETIHKDGHVSLLDMSDFGKFPEGVKVLF